jgi:hypothetical protein
MKMLHIYRSQPDDTVNKLVEVINEGNEAESFDLSTDNPDYDKLVEMLFEADKAITWW